MKDFLIDFAEYLIALWEFFWPNRWDVFLFIGMLIYRKELYVALAGGNGKLQMDEIGKGLILLIFYLSFNAERERLDLASNVFPESYWFAIIGGVFLIAGLKGASDYFKYKSRKEDDKPEL